MDEDYYENGRFRGRKDSTGHVFDENYNMIAVENSDGSYLDLRTGSIWRKVKRN